jgi:mannose-6-phosphate isomerase-like protein (cupin superfamily)
MCFGPEIAAAASAIGSTLATAAPYAATAATVAGTYAQNRQARAQQEELNRQQQAEAMRQRQMQEEANQRISQAQQEFSPENVSKALGTAYADRSAAMAPVAPQQQSYEAHTASAPVEVKSDAERQEAAALAKVGQEGNARAKLGAFGDLSLGQSFALNRAGQDIGRIRGFSQGSTAVHPHELQGAARAGRRWGAAGDIANTLGHLGSLYSMTRAPRNDGIGYGLTSGAMSSHPGGPY